MSQELGSLFDAPKQGALYRAEHEQRLFAQMAANYETLRRATFADGRIANEDEALTRLREQLLKQMAMLLMPGFEVKP